MTDRNDLIQQVIGLQEKCNQSLLEYRLERWLSLNLTIAQLKSIIYIFDKGEVSFKEVAEALNVTPSVVTGIVDRLVSHGMVKRKQMNSADRRMQWLVVTEKGKNILDNIRQHTIQNISQILETLSDEELLSLIKGLSALIKATAQYLKEKPRILELDSELEKL